jgi:hypothetical protein
MWVSAEGADEAKLGMTRKVDVQEYVHNRNLMGIAKKARDRLYYCDNCDYCTGVEENGEYD